MKICLNFQQISKSFKSLFKILSIFILQTSTLVSWELSWKIFLRKFIFSSFSTEQRKTLNKLHLILHSNQFKSFNFCSSISIDEKTQNFSIFNFFKKKKLENLFLFSFIDKSFNAAKRKQEERKAFQASETTLRKFQVPNPIENFQLS